MNDQTWAMVLGFAVAVGLRMVDLLLPRGRALKWVWQRTVSLEDKDEDGEQS